MMKRNILPLLLICLLFVSACPAVRAEETPVFSSLQELKYYLDDETWFLKDEIEFSYTGALDDVLSKHENLHDLMYNYGAWKWEQQLNTGNRHVRLSNIEYLPGKRVVSAFSTIGEHILTGEEQRLLNKALDVSYEAYQNSQSDLDVARWLHDYLCHKVTYQEEDEGSLNDTAIGALLNGYAECDGYADAFYLLCRLSGIQVNYQRGYAGGTGEENRHIWNLISLNGKWYHADVTWDDKDSSAHPYAVGYRYYCCGSHLMDEHSWDSRLSSVSIEYSTDWNGYVYTCNVNGVGAYYDNLRDAAAYVDWCKDNGYDQAHVMVDGIYEDGVYFNEVMENLPIYGRWTTWAKPAVEYTCFDVLFFD